MNSESNGPQRQLGAVGDVMPFTRRDASTINECTVAAVPVLVLKLCIVTGGGVVTVPVVNDQL